MFEKSKGSKILGKSKSLEMFGKSKSPEMLGKSKRVLARYMNIFKPNNERNGQTVTIKRERARITQLPDELLLLIKSFLSLTSQACLALTCRAFFIFMGAVLDSREFDLPRIEYSHRTPGFRPWFPGHSLRWELLCLLEDARWLFCPDCIKLHPISTFTLRKRDKEFLAIRDCFYGDFNGIVEICPCIRMTFGEKLKLVAQLESSEGKAHTENSPFWHECLTVCGTETVLTQAQPTLREDGSLIFQMRYEIRTDVSPGEGLQYMPIFTCCIRTIRKTISCLPLPKSTVCIMCKTSPVSFTYAEKADGWYSTLETRRNLGNGRTRVDDAWFRQRSWYFTALSRQERERWKRENQESMPSDAA